MSASGSGTGRGRGAASSTKRQFKPNLATANKRDVKQEQQADKSSGNESRGGRGRGRGGERGARGRGRGARGASTTVETAGIFSQGPAMLATVPAGDSSSYTFNVGGSGGGGGGGGSHKMRSSIGGGSTKMEVDDAEDSQQLEEDQAADDTAMFELLKDDFIAHKKQSHVAPVSMMHQEPKLQPKHKPITPKNEKRIESDSESDSEVAQTSEKQMPRLSVAKALVQRPADEDSAEPKYFTWNFPPKFAELIKAECAEADMSTESTGNPDADPKTRHSLQGIAQSQVFGKVQMLRSGKARLVVGKQTFPIAAAVDVQCKQQFVSIECGKSEQQPGDLFVLGNINQRFNVCVDAERLVQQFKHATKL